MIFYVVVQEKASLEPKIIQKYYNLDLAQESLGLLKEALSLFGVKSHIAFITQVHPKEETIFLPFKNERARENSYSTL